MTEMDIMKALGEIREEYIEEADPESLDARGVKGRQRTRKLHGYVRTLSAVAAAAVLLISFGLYRNMMQGKWSDTAPGSFSESASTDTATSDAAYAGESADTSTDASTSTDTATSTDASAGIDIGTDAAEATESNGGSDYTDTAGAGASSEIGEGTADAVRCDTLREAEDIAGFSLTVESVLPGCSVEAIYAEENGRIEICYERGSEAGGYRIVKSRGQYPAASAGEAYDASEIWDVDGRQIRMQGDETRFVRAEWETQDDRYLVELKGITLDETEWVSLLSGIR